MGSPKGLCPSFYLGSAFLGTSQTFAVGHDGLSGFHLSTWPPPTLRGGGYGPRPSPRDDAGSSPPRCPLPSVSTGPTGLLRRWWAASPKASRGASPRGASPGRGRVAPGEQTDVVPPRVAPGEQTDVAPPCPPVSTPRHSPGLFPGRDALPLLQGGGFGVVWEAWGV